jgi:hypothetical protein
MAGKPKTIDEYLAGLSDDTRAALEMQGRVFEADDFDAALATLDAASWRGRGEAE